MKLASFELILKDAQFVIKNTRKECWYPPGDGTEAATCLFLYKFNLFLVKHVFNFVALSQALNASREIKVYLPFPFMVRKRHGDPRNLD